VHSLSNLRLQEIVAAMHYGSQRWLQARTKSCQLNRPDSHADILCLAYLLDTIVLCVYSSGVIVLWNTQHKGHTEAKPASVWELWGEEPWTSALACVDGKHQSAYVVVTRAQSRYVSLKCISSPV
jgi:hypothetical protein